MEALQTDLTSQQVKKQHGIRWSDHVDLLVAWYSSFIKADLHLQLDIHDPSFQLSEDPCLEYILREVVFREAIIQEFFSELDLTWQDHKPIVKKLVMQVLADFAEKKEKNTSLDSWGSTSSFEIAKIFYNTLIRYALTQDQAFETIIKQHVTNWSMDRIVLLDKVIIKLALTEMMHLANIPVKVSINEYIDLSKVYSTPKSSDFINGVLDAIDKTL